ncbi:MAG TPA: bifunctional UDP-N-acetylglucosamine diphosphorylase/glucosamine-1-phosphate N-acetyltransferase GlmU [Bryobacteraceae bacterium]|nr:bifunctional UDP-N-acetylglucosamine diphosphorylase/glucosamine-1-phosphate N-acetyltransferase GlmU [Bryobacteraceae bacterium]
MKSKTTVVILAAGLGTRMRSSKAKVLHQAGGDTLLNHVIRAAMHVASAEHIVAVIGHQSEQVMASVNTPGVLFAEQKEQNGTGHAVLCCRDLIVSRPGNLLILNGDGPLLKPETLKALVDLQEERAGGGCIISTEVADPTGYGRIVRNASGDIAAIVEEKAATPEQRTISEINTGVYIFDGPLFWKYIDELKPENAAREYYLTDMVEILGRHGHSVSPMLVADETELLGINTRAELAVADRILRNRKNHELMLSGITIENPDSVLIDFGVTVGLDTLIGANVQLRGATSVGANCSIGAGSILRDCAVGDGVNILPYVVAENTRIGDAASIGPFARFRQSVELGENVHIGNFVELKKTTMRSGAKANHLAYLGDSTIGSRVNVGAGTITCNYDGQNKFPTEIGDDVFVGSNSTLVAPLQLGAGSYVAAGSVITDDVDADALALGRGRQVNKPGWAKKRRERNRAKDGEPRK